MVEMSSISKRQRDGRITYLVRWRDASGKQLKRSFARKIDAQTFATKLDSSLLAGTYVDPAKSTVDIQTWVKVWLHGQSSLKVTTRTRYEGLVRNQILPRWARVPLSKVTHADVCIWVSDMVASGLAPGSVRQAYRVLSLILGLAVRDGRLARNVCDHVPLPKARRNEPRFLSVDELHRLADATGDSGLVVLLLGYTGLRFGELTALRVGSVDPLKRRLTVSESASEVAGRLVFSDTKTHQTRTVALPRFLADQLAPLMVGRPRDALLMTSPNGGPLRLNNWRRDVWANATREAGLDDITPHDLRHTAASLAVSAGANVKVVQRMLGHASAAMTLDVYAGLFQTDLDSVAERMESLAPRVRPDSNVADLDAKRNAV
jgi:integrase